MPLSNASNFLETSLKTGILSTDTTMELNNLPSNVNYPTPPFRLRLGNDVTKYEVVNVTSRNENVLDITRDYEGTGAFNHESGTLVINAFTAGHWQELKDELNSLASSSDLHTPVLFALAGNVNGVIRTTGNSLQVVENSPPSLFYTVTQGYCFVNADLYTQTEDYVTTVAVDIPSVNPRIDIVTISSSAMTPTLIQGIENVSPTAPSTPAGHLLLAQIYMRTGSTTVKNTDDAVNGYITDMRSFI